MGPYNKISDQNGCSTFLWQILDVAKMLLGAIFANFLMRSPEKCSHFALNHRKQRSKFVSKVTCFYVKTRVDTIDTYFTKESSHFYLSWPLILASCVQNHRILQWVRQISVLHSYDEFESRKPQANSSIDPYI